MNKFFASLLVFVPIVFAASYFHLGPAVVFFLSAVAIIPLAKFIGEATEELALYSGSTLGAFLNATFGNAPELIIGVFAIRAGLVEVVKASITGSIISNLLLVSGMAIFLGGLKHKKQEFNRTAVMAAGSSLLLSVIALVVPALFLQTAPAVGPQVIEQLSVFVSIAMIAVYLAGLWFSFHTHKHLYFEEIGKFEARWTKRKSVLVLLLATLAVSFMSGILVDSIKPIVSQFGWTEMFLGVVFIAIIGNAAEHASAVMVAVKNRMDLALQVSIGSATQIAIFVAPCLVLISLLFPTKMSLVFSTFELAVIAMSILITNFVAEDGETNWLEGLQLLTVYMIMAVAFFFHP